MKVLLKKNVAKLGHVGDVVDVQDGYARNYLLPQRMAIEPTVANLKAIEVERQKNIEELAKLHKELEAKATVVEGKEVTMTARANSSGQLYGSVGPAQISAALAEDGVLIDAEYIALDEPIRMLDKYDVLVKFSEEVRATIHVWIVPAHEEEDDEDVETADQETDDSNDDKY